MKLLLSVLVTTLFLLKAHLAILNPALLVALHHNQELSQQTTPFTAWLMGYPLVAQILVISVLALIWMCLVCSVLSAIKRITVPVLGINGHNVLALLAFLALNCEAAIVAATTITVSHEAYSKWLPFVRVPVSTAEIDWLEFVTALVTLTAPALAAEWLYHGDKVSLRGGIVVHIPGKHEWVSILATHPSDETKKQ